MSEYKVPEVPNVPEKPEIPEFPGVPKKGWDLQKFLQWAKDIAEWVKKSGDYLKWLILFIIASVSLFGSQLGLIESPTVKIEIERKVTVGDKESDIEIKATQVK